MATETIVVVSKVKEYVKTKGMQTSETAVDALSSGQGRLTCEGQRPSDRQGSRYLEMVLL